jgi:hypothetical protein
MAATMHVSPGTPVRIDRGRMALRVDGVACTITGAAALIGCSPISDLLGVNATAPLAAIGAGMLIFGLWLLRRTRAAVPRALVRTMAIANVIWVVISVAMLELGTPAFSRAGAWLVGIVAALFALVAVAEFAAQRSIA